MKKAKKTKGTGMPAPSLGVIIFGWFLTILCSAFYLLSSAGWFAATFLFASHPGSSAAKFLQSLTPLDWAVRVAQVVLIDAACVLLILRSHWAVRLLLACLIVSILATLFYARWTITFLGGFGVLILGPVTAFASLLAKRGFLTKKENRPNKEPKATR